jgi:ERF superfamily
MTTKTKPDTETPTLWQALIAAQGELTNPKAETTGQVAQRKYKYADLASVMDHVRPILASHGLCIVQRPIISDDRMAILLETNLCHTSGAMIDSIMPVCGIATAPQQVGSALTYARRYAIMAMLGIAAEQEDDDGSAATQGYKPPQQRREPPRAPVAQPAVASSLDPNETDWDAKAREWIEEIDRCRTIDELHAFAAKRGADLRLMSQHDQNGYAGTQSSWKRRMEEVKRGAPPAPPMSRHRPEQAAMPNREGEYEKALDDE